MFNYKVNKIDNYSKRTMLEEVNDLVLIYVNELK
jgi:hypothetical protein